MWYGKITHVFTNNLKFPFRINQDRTGCFQMLCGDKKKEQCHPQWRTWSHAGKNPSRLKGRHYGAKSARKHMFFVAKNFLFLEIEPACVTSITCLLRVKWCTAVHWRGTNVCDSNTQLTGFVTGRWLWSVTRVNADTDQKTKVWIIWDDSMMIHRRYHTHRIQWSVTFSPSIHDHYGDDGHQNHSQAQYDDDSIAFRTRKWYFFCKIKKMDQVKMWQESEPCPWS